ncbi:MAG: choice-of-anchor B family protein [Nocardioidaceae bacterium]
MRRRIVVPVVALLGLVLSAMTTPALGGGDDHHDKETVAIAASADRLMHRQRADIVRGIDAVARRAQVPLSGQRCNKGHAGVFPCKNVDLKSYVPLANMSALSGNDIWGWTDGKANRRYALVGLNNGTGFVDVTRPAKPRYLGKLPTQTEDSIWRDIKIYRHYAFVVSEAANHGMQVFDLRRLRGVDRPETFTSDAYYGEFTHAHNIAVNEKSGYAYVLGSDTCKGGLHMVDIRRPLFPTFAGCYSGDGYTHDVQVVNYRGPDARYTGHEIAFAANEDTLTIVDVTNKKKPRLLSRTGYRGAAYTHQGWLTNSQRYFVLGDEVDELATGHNTRTYVFDVGNLVNPSQPSRYTADTAAIDHNLFIRGKYVYQANYRAGFRLLEARDFGNADFRVAGYFDIYPTDDRPEFNGAWGVYPLFRDRHLVLINGIEQGLFVLRTRV